VDIAVIDLDEAEVDLVALVLIDLEALDLVDLEALDLDLDTSVALAVALDTFEAIIKE